MRKTLIASLALGFTAFVASGCVSKSEYMKQVHTADQLEQELAQAKARNRTLDENLAAITKDRAELELLLKSRSDELSKAVTELRQRVAALGGENARLAKDLDDERKAREDAQQAKEEKVREVSSTYEQLLKKMKSEIAQGQVTISELKGKLTVNLMEAILFDSGKAEVKPSGLVVLGKVIEILKTVNDKAVRIEGHTDDIPIKPPLTQRYPTNWELSAARAINVARYLQKQAINPANLSAAGFGEFKPVADNASVEGRAKNRRIEIVLVPKD
jgi:chemotaxis protein MotB